ncbi:helix-turn-helix domain-containing protein [Kitasatospora sp. NPDC053057]|uniref:helix-turn-helix domain-containing protein n=1 Tax=Kitasatospora sp. NPDC053057 TaxID=3364062 RepID=UPI0037C59D31
MAERVQVREIDDDEGRRLLRIARRGTGSVVTWRRAQMVLLSAQRMPVAKIAEVTFTSADRVRDVIHNFNADGFDSLYPKYKGGRPRTFTLPERREIKKIAKSKPAEHGLPFSTWSLAKLADFLVAEGVVDDISHELHPADVHIAIICDNYSPHLTTKRCQRVGTWAAANNVEIAYTPTNSSWLNRIEAQFTALRYFALDGTDHASHKEQGSMIRRYIIWRNKHAADERLRAVVTRANVA